MLVSARSESCFSLKTLYNLKKHVKPGVYFIQGIALQTTRVFNDTKEKCVLSYPIFSLYKYKFWISPLYKMKNSFLKYHKLEIPSNTEVNWSKINELAKKIPDDVFVEILTKNAEQVPDKKDNVKLEKNENGDMDNDFFRSLSSISNILSGHDLALAYYTLTDLKTKWRTCYHIAFDKKYKFLPGDSLSLYTPYALSYIKNLISVLRIRDDVVKIKAKNIEYQGLVSTFLCYFMPGVVKKRHLLIFFKNYREETHNENRLKEILIKEEVIDEKDIGAHKENGEGGHCVDAFYKLQYLIHNYSSLPSISFSDVLLNLKIGDLKSLLSCCAINEFRSFSFINRSGEFSEIILGKIDEKTQPNCLIKICNENEQPEKKEFIFDKKTKVHDFMRYGKTSTFLEEDSILPLFIKPRKNRLLTFHPAERMILIATGTGIAPFLSFLRNNTADDNIKFLIVYGCREVEDDLLKDWNGTWYRKGKVGWYYENETSGENRKIPTNETIGFVNFKNPLQIIKVSSKFLHVQHFLQNLFVNDKNGNNDLLFYICGNPKMQKSVYNVIKDRWKKAAEERRIFFDNWD